MSTLHANKNVQRFGVCKVKGQIITFHAVTFVNGHLLDCKIAYTMTEHPTKQLISLD